MYIPLWFIGMVGLVIVLSFIRMGRLAHRLRKCERTVRQLEGIRPDEDLEGKTGDGD